MVRGSTSATTPPPESRSEPPTTRPPIPGAGSRIRSSLRRPRPPPGQMDVSSPTTTRPTTSSTTPRRILVAEATDAASLRRVLSGQRRDRGGVIANFCGQVARLRFRRPGAGDGSTGGLTRRKLHGHYPNFWGQASLGVLGGTAYFLATGYGTGPSDGPIGFPAIVLVVHAATSPRRLALSNAPMHAKHFSSASRAAPATRSAAMASLCRLRCPANRTTSKRTSTGIGRDWSASRPVRTLMPITKAGSRAGASSRGSASGRA